MNTNCWFKLVKIDNDTYAIKEDSHSEETNSYLLLDETKALLIDTGMGVENIFDVIKDKIKGKKLIVAITHAHWDHIGSNEDFDFIMIHEAEASWLNNFPISLTQVKEELLKTNLPFPKDFNIENYKLPKKEATIDLKGEEIINLGNRKLKVIHTPGHSPGHLVFYEESRKYLFSGDLIYKGELDSYYDSTEPLLYRESINKLLPLDIKYIFGGHHDLFLSKDLLINISKAFNYLYENKLLYHHGKVYYFKNFSIRL